MEQTSSRITPSGPLPLLRNDRILLHQFKHKYHQSFITPRFLGRSSCPPSRSNSTSLRCIGLPPGTSPLLQPRPGYLSFIGCFPSPGSASGACLLRTGWRPPSRSSCTENWDFWPWSWSCTRWGQWWVLRVRCRRAWGTWERGLCSVVWNPGSRWCRRRQRSRGRWVQQQGWWPLAHRWPPTFLFSFCQARGRNPCCRLATISRCHRFCRLVFSFSIRRQAFLINIYQVIFNL